MATTTAIIATGAAVASGAAQIHEVSPWFSYSVDILLAVLFFAILFFTKPGKDTREELTPEEMPNELEKVLKTDTDNDSSKTS